MVPLRADMETPAFLGPNSGPDLPHPLASRDTRDKVQVIVGAGSLGCHDARPPSPVGVGSET